MQGLRSAGLVVVADLSGRGRKAKTKWLRRIAHRHSVFLEADGSARLRVEDEASSRPERSDPGGAP